MKRLGQKRPVGHNELKMFVIHNNAESGEISTQSVRAFARTK
jgi:hypothetical protein